MKSYRDILAEVSAKYNYKGVPDKKHLWLAYAGGKYLGYSYISERDAKEKFKAAVVECFVENEAEIEAARALDKKVYQEAFDLWYSALREEYGNLPSKVFELCYNKAYEDGHSSGYDEVANCMIDMVYFAEQIMFEVSRGK